MRALDDVASLDPIEVLTSAAVDESLWESRIAASPSGTRIVPHAGGGVEPASEVPADSVAPTPAGVIDMCTDPGSDFTKELNWSRHPVLLSVDDAEEVVDCAVDGSAAAGAATSRVTAAAATVAEQAKR